MDSAGSLPWASACAADDQESLHHDIIRLVRACDQQGVTMTVDLLYDQLAAPEDLLLGVLEQLRRLQLIRWRRNGVLTLGVGQPLIDCPA